MTKHKLDKRQRRLQKVKQAKAVARHDRHGKAGPHSSKKGDAGYDRKKEKDEVQDHS